MIAVVTGTCILISGWGCFTRHSLNNGISHIYNVTLFGDLKSENSFILFTRSTFADVREARFAEKCGGFPHTVVKF